MEGKESKIKTIIARDFNARTRRKRGKVSIEEEEDGETKRKSKDRKVNKERRRLLECIKERGWTI